MSLQDYSAIRALIDDIVGIDTKQGSNLKKAIKNYFDTKPTSVKFINKDNVSFEITGISEHTSAADKAMKRYTQKLKNDVSNLKEKGEYCGVGVSE